MSRIITGHVMRAQNKCAIKLSKINFLGKNINYYLKAKKLFQKCICASGVAMRWTMEPQFFVEGWAFIDDNGIIYNFRNAPDNAVRFKEWLEINK